MYNRKHRGKEREIKQIGRKPSYSHLTFKVTLMFTLTFFCIHKFEIKMQPFFLQNGNYVRHFYKGILCLKPQNLALFSRVIYSIEEECVCGNHTIMK